MIILKILSVIGMALLYIIAFILALFLIVLFVPVRYKIEGSYKDKLADFKAKVSYLGFLLTVTFIFKDKKSDLTIRILGFKLKKRKNKSKKAQSINDESNEEEQSDKDRSDSPDEGFEEDEEEKDSFIKKLQKIKKEIEFYNTLIKKNSTKRAYETFKKNLLSLIKCIVPRKGRINIHLGLQNPGTTGKILGAYKALYDYIGKVVHFYPFFDREYIDADCKVKSSIYPVSLVYIVLKTYFNKDCRRLIKILRKKFSKAPKPERKKDE